MQHELMDTICKELGFPVVESPIDVAAKEVAELSERDVDILTEAAKADQAIEHTLQDHPNDQ